ncbi:GNAT family N-acetyltransferase [Desulfococcaceae bacterium OttesenSCG-928-F15]|nr:GNAT family N-acetyltransferase [Desulfococcaceae bacterium OttesenSCG-928-F15]
MKDFFQIRKAEAGDWPALWQILLPVFKKGETYPHPMNISEEEAFSYWMKSPEAAFLACDKDDRILGTYYLKPNQPGLGSHVCNCGYAVAEAARRRGIARRLCAHSLDEARKRGYRAMQFNFVVSTNIPAVTLWKQMGFQLIGTLPKAFHKQGKEFVDALVMFQSLTDNDRS